jgi:hypothetical protein
MRLARPLPLAALALALGGATALAQEASPPEPGSVRLSEPRLVPVTPPGEARGSPLGGALQVGYAAPWGSVSGAAGDRFTRIVAAAIPLQAEVTWAFDAHDRAGVFGAFAFASPGAAAPACSGAADCSASAIRAGALVRHVFAPGAPLASSLALGLGWERDSLAEDAPGGRSEAAAEGVFALLSFSAERRVAAALRAGPYVAVLAGSAARAKTSTPDAPGGWRDVRDRAFHGWVEIGARVSVGR